MCEYYSPTNEAKPMKHTTPQQAGRGTAGQTAATSVAGLAIPAAKGVCGPVAGISAPGPTPDMAAPNFRPKAGRRSRPSRAGRNASIAIQAPYRRVTAITIERYDWQHTQYVPVAMFWYLKPRCFRATILAVVAQDCSRPVGRQVGTVPSSVCQNCQNDCSTCFRYMSPKAKRGC